MARIYLIRHGQASFGSRNYDQLSQRGTSQATLLGRWFRDCGIQPDRIITGALVRHTQTAQACLDELATPISNSDAWRQDSGFNEYDHEDMIACAWPDLKSPDAMAQELAKAARPQQRFQEIFVASFDRWMSGDFDQDYKEAWPDFRQRVSGALQRAIAEAGKAQTTFVFTSGGAISCLVAELMKMDLSSMAKLNSLVVNSSVTQLLYSSRNAEQSASVSYFNAYPHLENCGDSKMTTYR